MQKWVLRADVDLDPVLNSQSLNRLKAIGNPLIAPLISGGNSESEQIDDTLSIELSGHNSDLTIVADGVEVGVDNYFRRIGEGRRGGERQAKQKTT